MPKYHKLFLLVAVVLSAVQTSRLYWVNLEMIPLVLDHPVVWFCFGFVEGPGWGMCRSVPWPF